MSQVSEKIINFSGLRFRYDRLSNKKKLILPLGNYFKTLKGMIIGIAGTFPDKDTPGIDFTDEAVVQCDVRVVRTLLQVLVIYK